MLVSPSSRTLFVLHRLPPGHHVALSRQELLDGLGGQGAQLDFILADDLEDVPLEDLGVSSVDEDVAPGGVLDED